MRQFGSSGVFRVGLFFFSLLSACGGKEKIGQVQIPDASVPMMRSDGGTPPAPPPDGGAPKEECPCTFVEEFTDQAHIDSAATTAMVETTGAGALIAPAAFTMESPGAGTEGALVATTPSTLAPGNHDYASISLQGAAVTIAGSTTLRVTGSVDMSRGASLTVTGNLTLIAGGNIVVDCSRIVTTGSLTIHQPAGDFTVRCAQAGQRGEVLTDLRTSGDSGALQIWSRGAVRATGSVNIYTGSVSGAGARSGALDIRSYGDVSFGPGTGLIATGGTLGGNGDLNVATEGRLTVDGLRVAGGDSTAETPSGGSVRLHARGAIAFQAGGNLLSSPAGSIEIYTEGALTLENTSFILTPPGGGQTASALVHVRARTLRVGSAQYPGDRSSIIARAGSRRAANLMIETREEIQFLEEATVGTPVATCVAAGDVTILTEKTVSLGARAFVKAGDSVAGAGCSAAKGGSLTIRAAGAINNSGAVATGGVGSPNGATMVMGSQDVRIGVLAAELTPMLQATSKMLPIDGTVAAPNVTMTSLGTSDPASYAGLHLTLSAAADYVSDQYLPVPIAAQWRYQLLVEPRAFDPIRLDSFSLEYR